MQEFTFAHAGGKKSDGPTQAQLRLGKRELDADTCFVLHEVHRQMARQTMTVAELARRSRIKVNVLYQILDPLRYGCGGSIRLNVVRQLAQGLDIPIAELLDLQELP
jgi:hypothetical protein